MPSPWTSDDDDETHRPLTIRPPRRPSMSSSPTLSLPAQSPPTGSPPTQAPRSQPKERKKVWIQGYDERPAATASRDSPSSSTSVSRTPSRPSTPNPNLLSPPSAFATPAGLSRRRGSFDTSSRDNDRTHAEIKHALNQAFGDEARDPSHLPTKPRPILRRGDSHAAATTTSYQDDIADFGRKEHSARRAHDRARSVASSVASTPVSPAQSPDGPSRRSSFESEYNVDLYNSGDRLVSGQTTPISIDELDYIPKPSRYRTAGLGSLLKLSHAREAKRRGGLRHTEKSRSTTSLAELIHASATVSSIGGNSSIEHAMGDIRPRRRPGLSSHNSLASLKWPHGHKQNKPHSDAEVKIQWHIQETFSRQKYLIKLCRALMQYGAPPHRLEEYMRMSARSLDIEAQFLFLPGCMVISFDDSQTHTAEVKLVKLKAQAIGVDLGKLRDAHYVYKKVVHDLIGVDEATKELDDIMSRKDKFGKYTVIFFYGLACFSVGTWAYQARFIDLGLIFLLGCLVGSLKRFALRTELYSNVFSIVATIVVSFLARALGSIWHGDQRLFCFSSMTQSSLTLILPGYNVLCAALELQSGSMVAGSVRMVHSIIYSLFLGYGITIGTVIYGAIDHDAVSAVNCVNPSSGPWDVAFVALFAISIIVINQGKFKQMPVMVLIAIAGWAVSHFSGISAFKNNAQVTSSLAAATVGVLANLYSRTSWVWDKVLRRFAKLVDPKQSDTQSISYDAGSKNPSPMSSPSNLEEQVPERHSTIYNWRLRLHTALIHASPTVRVKTVNKMHKRHSSSWQEHKERGDDSPVKSSRSSTMSTKDEKKRDADLANPVPIHVSHAVAAAAMIPAIWVLVPSGLSIHGSLLQGIVTADELTGVRASTANGTDATSSFGVGYAVLQVGIGITVGLYLSNLLVYPFGKGPQVEGKRAGKAWKMRSGLFSL